MGLILFGILLGSPLFFDWVTKLLWVVFILFIIVDATLLKSYKDNKNGTIERIKIEYLKIYSQNELKMVLLPNEMANKYTSRYLFMFMGMSLLTVTLLLSLTFY